MHNWQSQLWKEFGVIAVSFLNSSALCSVAAKRANKMLGITRMDIENKTDGIILLLYKASVR